MGTALRERIISLTGGDDSEAESAVRELAELARDRPDEVLNALNDVLNSGSTDERWWGVRLLAEISDGQSRRLLRTALHDEDRCVRQCAALGIRVNPHLAATADLIGSLNDEDHLVVELAADALTEIGERAVPALLEVVEEGTAGARLAALRALAAIGDQRAIPKLYSLLDDDSQLAAYWANEGLERMGAGMVYFKP